MVIAIDGPAGAGKSTVARLLAERLGFTYLDSGAMYRAIALLHIRSPNLSIKELARDADIAIGSRVVLDGRDVTDAIRVSEVSDVTSVVAADPGVRAALLVRQRNLLASGDWVAEGRDIGTVVAPDADLKVFLDADPRERARRRAAELGADVETVLAEQKLRDERDSLREHSPLVPAKDAVVLDATGLGVEEVVGRIAALVDRL